MEGESADVQRMVAVIVGVENCWDEEKVALRRLDRSCKDVKQLEKLYREHVKEGLCDPMFALYVTA